MSNTSKKDPTLLSLRAKITKAQPNIDHSLLDALRGSAWIPATLSAANLSYGDIFSEDHRKLDKDISDLKQQIAELVADKGDLSQTKTELEQKVKDLSDKVRLNFLLDSVNKDGQRVLTKSPPFQQLFLGQTETPAFVMSIDIRRSTELMLKARNAQAFASFITELCKELMDIIKESYGVIDKFSGDGVLAFFPEFYSGTDAAYRTICTAAACHSAFSRRYANSRASFKSILNNVGLGIGIDYGNVHLVKKAAGLTVVGEPVVYACRLSAAPAGKTLLNQPAYEKVMEKFGAYCFVYETELEIKHEGSMLAYAVTLNDKNHVPNIPDWAGQDETLGAR